MSAFFTGNFQMKYEANLIIISLVFRRDQIDCVFE